MSVEPAYSPLCDVDVQAYLSYSRACAARSLQLTLDSVRQTLEGLTSTGVGEEAYIAYCRSIGNGASVVWDNAQRYARCGREGNCGGDDVVRNVDIDVCARGRLEWPEVVLGGSRDFVTGAGDGSCRSCDSAVGGAGRASGISSDNAGGVSEHLAGGHSATESGHADNTAGPLLDGVAAPAVGGPQASAGDGAGFDVPEWRRKGCLPGETKLDRNRRWRLERKNRKVRKQGHGLRTTDESGVGDEPKGFFSACDESVRKELRDSRAALLIEKNKRDLLLAQRDNRRLQSNSELVREVLRDARLKDQVVKATGKLDAHVGGWAETVVTNSSEAIINEAASRKGSSLPSLESLSSSVADSSSYALRVRKTAYEKAMSDLEDAYGVTIIYDEEYQDEKFRIRQEFEDVVYTPEQRCNRNLVKQLMGELDEKSRRELLLATKHYNLDLALFD